MAEPYLKNLTEQIDALQLSLPQGVMLETKHFFSGAAFYANGTICGSLTPVGFALKLPAASRDQLMEQGEGSELRYFEKAPVKKNYVVLSQTIVEDRKRLRDFVHQSIEFVLA